MKPIDAYIRTARDRGRTDEEILNSLVESGWTKEQASTALHDSSDELLPPPPPPANDTQASAARPIGSTSSSGMNAWYAFEHILMFISLAVLAFSIALILNYFVDRYYPGMAEDPYSYRYGAGDTSVRGYLAALIVSLPLFGFLFLDITKRTIAHPELRNLLVRKLLIYLTLVVTFVTMLGYIIAAVYNFLGGNVTLNFLLHLLVTFVTAGSIFAYYLNQVKGDRKIHA